MPDLVVGDIGSVAAGASSDTTTCSDLIEATRRLLMTGTHDERNVLAADISSSATTLTISQPIGGIRAGSRLSIDLEDIYVFNGTGTSVTIQRGQWGTTATTHSSGTTILVNPKFSDFEIFKALNDVLRGLSSDGLFRTKTVDLTYSAAVQGYDLTSVSSDLIGVLDVRWKNVGPAANWPMIHPFTVVRNMATSEFASSSALILYEAAIPGRTVHVRYKSSFGLLGATTDVVTTTTGLWSEALDILPLGAAIRLTEGREIKRNFTESQGDTRRAEEVPAGANLNAMRMLQIEYQRRLSNESGRLAAEYPIRRGFL